MQGSKKERMSRLDVFTGIGISNIVMFAFIAATAQTLHRPSITNIQNAAQVAKAPRPFANVIFAL